MNGTNIIQLQPNAASTEGLHPLAAAAKARADDHKARRANEKAFIDTVAAHGVKFFEVGVYTLAYRVDKRNVIEVSSAIRHPGDKQDRHFGRLIAATRFQANNRMLMRMPARSAFGPRSPKKFLEYTFAE